MSYILLGLFGAFVLFLIAFLAYSSGVFKEQLDATKDAIRERERLEDEVKTKMSVLDNDLNVRRAKLRQWWMRREQKGDSNKDK